METATVVAKTRRVGLRIRLATLLLASLQLPPLALAERDALPRHDPASSLFGATDPLTSSLRANEELSRWSHRQQHRARPDPNLRQLRARRPEPGEVEVIRGEELMPLEDPLRATLRSILPQNR